MQKIFCKPAELEELAKDKFSVPPFLMMENAARAMADFILNPTVLNTPTSEPAVLIICGKGNNGGDGYALARMLIDKAEVTVLMIEEPAAQEACTQYEMCCKLGVKIIKELSPENNFNYIVDCLYGIGFRGELKTEIKLILDRLNAASGIKIACDIPSGLYFKADYTISMGEQKSTLYSDMAKTVCGKILVADLGIPRSSFESGIQPDAYLIEEADIKLPLRTNPAAHKGTYGHTAVFAGEKSGAAIIAATAAMNFGSGLTTLVKTENSNLEQFKISPELMISEEIPAKTTCIVIGPGLGTEKDQVTRMAEKVLNWAKTAVSPAIVFDADMMTWDGLPALLEELNKIENIKIILTPHLSELSRFVKDYDVKTLAQSSESKIELGKKLTHLYPKTAVVMKSANTFIACGDNIFVCTDGAQCLAKGGSGDVLAGMTGALLAQKYSLQDAVITAVEIHALSAINLGQSTYDLTPLKLINNLKK